MVQCNQCGSFDDLDECVHCYAPICKSCYLGHRDDCERVTKRRDAGIGRTIRTGPVAPRKYLDRNKVIPVKPEVSPAEPPLTALARAIEVPEVDYEPHQEAINPTAELFKILENHLSQLSDADRENCLAAVERLIKGDRE